MCTIIVNTDNVHVKNRNKTFSRHHFFDTKTTYKVNNSEKFEKQKAKQKELQKILKDKSE